MSTVIPEEELEFRFYRAGGPGGQNVNKVSTAVQMRFDVKNSSSLTEPVKARLMKLAGSRLTLDGVILINAVRFRTQETVERARLDEVEYQYLYDEGDDQFAFMNQETFEQISITGEIIGDQKIYLQEGMTVIVQMFEAEALSVQLPVTVVLEITEADPVVKGQTASSSYKPALLENGAKIMVPPHIEAGTKVVVKPEDGSYVERAK